MDVNRPQDSADPPPPTSPAEPSDPLEAAEEVLHPSDASADLAVQAQMDTLYQRDRVMAVGFLVALLIVLPFILIALWSVMPGAGVKVVLVASAVVLALYNGGSILKLLDNYRRDRDFIYRRDVAHLRQLREVRRELREAKQQSRATR